MLAAALLSGSASAEFSSSRPQKPGAVTHWSPDSNRQNPADVGVSVHTNVVGVLLPVPNVRPPQPQAGGRGLRQSSVLPSNYYYETPSSLACVYGLVGQTAGCNPTNTALPVFTGGSGLTIAIVEAYHNPYITQDLAAFSKQFGLPDAEPSGFLFDQLVDRSGGWSLKSSMDVEWAYAMSPNAKIILVEAASDCHERFDVRRRYGNEQGLSRRRWHRLHELGQRRIRGARRRRTRISQTAANVTYIASAGDAPGVIWPSSSPNVIAAGGTSISRDPATGNFIGEMTWQQTGSGISQLEALPLIRTACCQRLKAPVIGPSLTSPRSLTLTQGSGSMRHTHAPLFIIAAAQIGCPSAGRAPLHRSGPVS